MKTVHIEVEGIVQGVGFRPFLHRLASRHHICGWVRNTSAGLEGILEGEPEELERFLQEAGFVQVRRWGPLKLRPPKAGEERIFFTARKE